MPVYCSGYGSFTLSANLDPSLSAWHLSVQTMAPILQIKKKELYTQPIWQVATVWIDAYDGNAICLVQTHSFSPVLSARTQKAALFSSDTMAQLEPEKFITPRSFSPVTS